MKNYNFDKFVENYLLRIISHMFWFNKLTVKYFPMSVNDCESVINQITLKSTNNLDTLSNLLAPMPDIGLCLNLEEFSIICDLLQ